MSMNDPIANALSHIFNSESRAKQVVHLKPASKILKSILDIMNDEGYIGGYKEIEDSKGMVLEVNLIGKINKCGVIKPRFNLPKSGFEKFEKRFLPAKDFGVLIVSTNKGILTHHKAKKEGIGGKLIAYCY